MRLDPLPDLPGKVEAPAVPAQILHHSKALGRVVEPLRVQAVQLLLSQVAEGRVAQIVAQADGLRQVFVEVEGPCDGARYLGHLQGMGQTRYEVIAGGSDEDLCLVLESAEPVAVDDAVPVSLEFGPERRRLFGCRAAPGSCGPGGEGRQAFLPLLQSQSHLCQHVRRPLLAGPYSTVTDLARFRGWSISQPRFTAI